MGTGTNITTNMTYIYEYEYRHKWAHQHMVAIYNWARGFQISLFQCILPEMLVHIAAKTKREPLRWLDDAGLLSKMYCSKPNHIDQSYVHR